MTERRSHPPADRSRCRHWRPGSPRSDSRQAVWRHNELVGRRRSYSVPCATITDIDHRDNSINCYPGQLLTVPMHCPVPGLSAVLLSNILKCSYSHHLKQVWIARMNDATEHWRCPKCEVRINSFPIFLVNFPTFLPQLPNSWHFQTRAQLACNCCFNPLHLATNFAQDLVIDWLSKA